MTSPRACYCVLLLTLAACSAPDHSEAIAELGTRLDATDERLTAIEAKLDAVSTKLDGASTSMESVATWVDERKAEDAERDARREESRQRRERALGEGRVSDGSPDLTDPFTPGSRELEGAEEAIRCENLESTRIECSIDGAFLDTIVATPALLAKQARIVPSQRDGVTQGYKLYGIRRGSLPKLLGLKNGDLLSAVNGNPLDSVDRAMVIYTKLKTETRLEIDIVRKGIPLVLAIDVAR